MFYAVKVGRKPGVYENIEECEANVIAFPGAAYQSFHKRKDAYIYTGIPIPEREKMDEGTEPEEEQLPFKEVSQESKKRTVATEKNTADNVIPFAYVDGSFNNQTKTFGYGGYVVGPKGKEIIKGCSQDAELATMRNVAGEIYGAVAAIKKAIELRYMSITIYYDYTGIEAWANGKWARNKKGTQAYKEFIDKARKLIKIDFQKVKGHSGNVGNDEADALAREAVGL